MNLFHKLYDIACNCVAKLIINLNKGFKDIIFAQKTIFPKLNYASAI